MPQKYTLKTTMNCESCVAKVKPALLAKGISDSLKFDMKSPDKTVEFAGSEEQKNQAINILHELGYEASLMPSKKSFYITYKPLIIIGLFILGITALIEIKAGYFDFMRAMRSFMAGFFIFFSFFKLLNLQGFADAFSTYDIIAKKSRVYALIYPFIELALGVAFVLDIFPIIINIIVIIILGIGNIGVWQILKKNQVIQCACLGTIFELPMTKVTLFENSIMIIMAIISLIYLMV